MKDETKSNKKKLMEKAPEEKKSQRRWSPSHLKNQIMADDSRWGKDGHSGADRNESETPP